MASATVSWNGGSYKVSHLSLDILGRPGEGASVAPQNRLVGPALSGLSYLPWREGVKRETETSIGHYPSIVPSVYTLKRSCTPQQILTRLSHDEHGYTLAKVDARATALATRGSD